MKEFLALLKARNIEYYRDKGSLSWAFIFPLLIIVVCAVAFSEPDTSLLTVGIHGDTKKLQQLEILKQPYIKTIIYEDLTKAQQRIEHHQIDLLLSNQPSKQFWVNTESSNSQLAQQLLLSQNESFSQQEASGRAIRYVDWVIPGILGMNLMFAALFGVGYVIVRYRRNGVLKRLQATPIHAAHFLSAQMTSRLIIVVIVNSIIFVGCHLILDLIVLGSYFDLLLITVLGALSMSALGMLVAARTANEELASGLLNVATWPMLFLSELWFSLDDSPEWLQNFSNFMPLTHIVRAFRSVMIDGATLMEVSHHLLWLIAMTVICTLLAATLFRWTKG